MEAIMCLNIAAVVADLSVNPKTNLHSFEKEQINFQVQDPTTTTQSLEPDKMIGIGLEAKNDEIINTLFNTISLKMNADK